jgi:hypothetical protein
MAQSPSHKFGQIIGRVLEAAVLPGLQAVADEIGLYLDRKHRRPARGGQSKVCWTDSKGNTHDLDYVLERGGTEDARGTPKAFIEVAWRRYTKHSRNKAQEIQGAIILLAETYSDSRPFLGIVLAGVFTNGSINQLRSLGFNVLYFPYESMAAAFASVGVDARFDEDTPDAELQKKVSRYEALTTSRRARIATALRKRHATDLENFFAALPTTLMRAVQLVYVLPLHGAPRTLPSVEQAIAYVERYDESHTADAFVRYEIGVRYDNGDEIRGQFQARAAAIDFLRKLT